MAISQIFLAGDSLTLRTLGDYSNAFLGPGNWPDLFTEVLATRLKLPVLTSGIRGVHLVSEWAYSAGFTDVLTTDAFDKAPYNCSTTVPARYGNGATKTLTWTKPPGLRLLIGFNLYLVDKTGSGEISYSIDGGSFTNTGQTFIQDNKILKFYVNTPITSSLVIRCADAAGVAHDGLVIGIEAVYSLASTGLIVHDIAVTGQLLHNLVLATSGDRMAIFDSVKYGTGSPVTVGPTLGIVLLHLNDNSLGNTGTYNTDIGAFKTRVGSLAPIATINPWECLLYAFFTQANYRTQMKTTCTALGLPAPLDIFDQWTTQGWGDGSAGSQEPPLLAAGMTIDGTHQTAIGNLLLANLIVLALIASFAPSAVNVAPTYPSVATSTVPAAVVGAGIPAGTVAATASRPMWIY